jgi:hypothetical protein
MGAFLPLLLSFFSFLLLIVTLRSPSALPPPSTGSLRFHQTAPVAVIPSNALPLFSTLTDALHVTPFDQQLASALKLPVRVALECQQRSSTGTLGWSVAQWQEAVGLAASYRARRERTIAAMEAIPIANPEEWFDHMPPLLACGGRDASARPHDASLSRFGGSGDGGKWLCSLTELKAPCTIYSLGSFGDIQFEEAMAANTPCEIFTFDCAVPEGRMPTVLPPRVHFEPVCIGIDNALGTFQSLSTITKRLGHAKVHLLKMDIEGSEFVVFDAMRAAYQEDPLASYTSLPLQIRTEFHLVLPTVAKDQSRKLYGAFQNLLDIGYVPVSREFNTLCLYCEEFVFIRLAYECFQK